MGAGWRRLTERLKESTPVGKDIIALTDNSRNTHLMNEAATFSQQLKTIEKVVRDMKTVDEDMLSTARTVMLAPLPVLYEETAAVAGGQVKQLERVGGSDFSGEAISNINREIGLKMESQVLTPLKKWLAAQASLANRGASLEKLRLELDSRRRTVAELRAAVDGLRAKQAAKGASAKLQEQMDATLQKLQRKEGKLQVVHDSFHAQEAALHTELSLLVKDATHLKHYVVRAIRLQGEALLSAITAFGTVAEPSSPEASASGLSRSNSFKAAEAEAEAEAAAAAAATSSTNSPRQCESAASSVVSISRTSSVDSPVEAMGVGTPDRTGGSLREVGTTPETSPAEEQTVTEVNHVAAVHEEAVGEDQSGAVADDHEVQIARSDAGHPAA